MSARSQLVRDVLRLDKGKSVNITRELLLETNGKLLVNDWRVVWLPDDDISTMSMSDKARLRIDPAGMFAPSVTRVMYTEAPAFERASISQLNDTFAEMRRSHIGKRIKKVRRPGTNVFQKITIPGQRSRKVIFLAKEMKPKYAPKNLTEFAEDSTTKIPAKQIEFYDESEALIFSNHLRPRYDIESAEYKSGIPYQWITPKFYIHEFSMRQSQEFRCLWYNEYLSWGGGYDSEILSFAYVFGRKRLLDQYGERDIDSTSWIPLMDPEYPGHRMQNKRGYHLYFRIQEAS